MKSYWHLLVILLNLVTAELQGKAAHDPDVLLNTSSSSSVHWPVAQLDDVPVSSL
jgi:hypothetical protein